MKLFGSTTKLIDNTKHWEKVPSLEVVEVVLVQYNLEDNQFQQNTEVLYTFTPNKSYAYLLNVEPRNVVFLKTYNRVWWIFYSIYRLQWYTIRNRRYCYFDIAY